MMGFLLVLSVGDYCCILLSVLGVAVTALLVDFVPNISDYF